MAASEAKNPLNLKRFAKRAKSLHSFWVTNKENTKIWKGADALCIVSGGDNENATLNPTSANVQRYMLGYEFPKMIMLFTESKLIFVTTKKKGQLFPEASKYLASDAGFSIQCIEKVKTLDLFSNMEAVPFP